MNKRVFGLFLLFGLILSGVLPLVNAQFYPSGSFGDGIKSIIQILSDFLRPIFEALLGYGSTDEFFLAKCLLAILIFMVILVVLKKVPIFEGNKNVRIIVGLVISILSIRYLPETDLINGILLPYSVLGVAITTFLPFLIYFYFVHESAVGPFGRKAGWAVYGIIFGVLWWSKSTTGDLSQVSNYIYLTGLGLVILAFIFDKSIHGYFKLADFEKSEKNLANRQLLELYDMEKKLENALLNGRIRANEYNAMKKDITDKIKAAKQRT